MALLYIERMCSYRGGGGGGGGGLFQKITKPNLIELTPLNVYQFPLYATQNDYGVAVNQVVIRQLRFLWTLHAISRNVFIFHWNAEVIFVHTIYDASEYKLCNRPSKYVGINNSPKDHKLPTEVKGPGGLIVFSMAVALFWEQFFTLGWAEGFSVFETERELTKIIPLYKNVEHLSSLTSPHNLSHVMQELCAKLSWSHPRWWN